MIERLYRDSRIIIDYCLEQVRPDSAVKRALAEMPNHCGKTVLIAVGKAAWQMARAACDLITPDEGIVITKYGHCQGPINGLILREASHPLLDENSLIWGREAIGMVSGLSGDDLVIFLLSGGASALFEASDLPLAELQDISSQLLKCGADITEINTIRKRLSLIKGGRFGQRCRPARVFSIILSDIIGDPLDMIGSGPCAPDQSTSEQAFEVVRKYDLKLSEQALNLLRSETVRQLDNVTSLITGSVSQLCLAAEKISKELGYQPVIISDTIAGEARDEGAILARKALEITEKTALIQGGETVVHVTGNGLGGRNQELVLAGAPLIAGRKIALFSIGSDGTDGPTDAAGGYLDGDSAAELIKNENWIRYLENNDSYNGLKTVDGLIFTGPTGTNVNDLTVALIGPEETMPKDYYDLFIPQFRVFAEGAGYLCTLLANTSALIYEILPDLNWAGYYLYRDDQLILGPFQGKTACEIIQMDRGVCGYSASRQEAVVVKDVHQFPGHIACDSASNSEIVIPIIVRGALFGVLDIDSPLLNRFDETDRKYLQEAVNILQEAIERLTD
ncbi:MAG: DUF4147 domain-containing protein [Erysipelotrichaceae bacterium]|nr:DUF4147 domain-containing protein [Erysipelotrichaceae bacterium]